MRKLIFGAAAGMSRGAAALGQKWTLGSNYDKGWRGFPRASPYFFADNTILFLKEPARAREHFSRWLLGKCDVWYRNKTCYFNHPKLHSISKK